jgi:putative DNA primase/helicase
MPTAEEMLVRGWSVIPVRADKRPAIPSWKEWQWTRPSVSQVREWTRKLRPKAWAVVCGAISGIFALDFDGRAGNGTLKTLGLLPHVRTGSGGYHAYVEHPGFKILTINSKAKEKLARIYPGMDIRGDGGYAIFTGTNNAGSYESLRPPDPVPFDSLPAELRELLTKVQEESERPNGTGKVAEPSNGRVPSERLLRQALERVATDGRNNTGFGLAVQLRDNGYSETQAENVMLEYAARAPSINIKGQFEPYLATEVRASLRQAYSRPPRERWNPPGITGDSDDATRFPLTEYGNAERLIEQYGPVIRYCHVLGHWLHWDGRRWVADTTGEVVRLAKLVVRGICSEAARARDKKLREEIVQWTKKSERSASISAMLKLAESEPGVPLSPNELDTDPWLLNCLNGCIDLRTGELKPHNPRDIITKLIQVKCDPEATCPRWTRFLAEVFAPYPDIIPFIQNAVGYSITGDTREESLFLLCGPGRNGKGTFIKIVATMLADYAGTADFSTFVRRRYDGGPRDDIAVLKGRRFVSAQESREGAAFDESILKWLTGGDRVRARLLYQNSYEFDPVHKLWLATNHRPVIRGTDSAIWSRIKLIPFDVSFEGREDKTLKESLLKELPGILAWSVEGCLRWQTRGLEFPESVVKATREYRQDSDPLARFFEDSCIVSSYTEVRARKLYEAYRTWAEHSGENSLSETAFGNRLRERGFAKRHMGQGNVYAGIGIRDGNEHDGS